jgi:hypothetical protein
MNDLPFLDGEPIEEAVQEPIAEPEAPVTQAAEQVTPEAPVEPVEPARSEPIMVPLAALQEVRDELKAFKAAQQPQPVYSVPDPIEDPNGYNAYQAQEIRNATLNIAEEFARDKFGDELVDKARDWAMPMMQTNPAYAEHVLSQRNPYRFVVEQYQREQIASQVDLGEYEQFKAWKAAQAQVQSAPEPAPVAPAPRSLASIPSSGGAAHIPTGPGQAFDSLFR